MTNYCPTKIEKKWQTQWASDKLNATEDTAPGKKNRMILVEFPYPSGNLHMGHWYAFALPDMYARYQRMCGNNVMYPIGFDAFGLPAENAAIKHGAHPEQWTRDNISTMTRQMRSMGTMFDWSRAVSTIDPEYYLWTQWIFLQFYRNELAYRARTQVNWCPMDKTVLANEQVKDGNCERCGAQIRRRELDQWMLRITKYADRLVDELDGLDWPETTVVAQKNWIGRSRGTRITWELQGAPVVSLETFTTRPDTISGATFLVISPEVARQWLDFGWDVSLDVRAYVTESLTKRELDRLEGARRKTGVATGARAVHPLTGDIIPVWVADYVLGSYGTGTIMAVPAGDERDREFAEQFGLPSKEITGQVVSGVSETTYRLRDWIISRQRYWGCPIPIINCSACGYVPVPDADLPVKLPPLDDFKPADDGRSPLAKATEWLRIECPGCGGPAERETDTMDTFVDSSWYFMRYTDSDNTKKFADSARMKKWLPASLYIGGAEHNTMHLLYSRFFTKALHDLGYVDFDEPFVARRNHGIILGSDGQKMSKSKDNVIDPDKEVAEYGADAVRMYLAFMAPYEHGGPWDPNGIIGVRRFLNRVWALFGCEGAPFTSDVKGAPSHDCVVDRALALATKKIGEDLERLHFNTCISELMKLLNVLEDHRDSLTTDHRAWFALLLAPFAPYFAEELWRGVLGKEGSVHLQQWPEYDPALLVKETISLPVQVNGKFRGAIIMAPDARQDDAVFAARASEQVARHVEGRATRRVVYVPGKMLNIVVDS